MVMYKREGSSATTHTLGKRAARIAVRSAVLICYEKGDLSLQIRGHQYKQYKTPLDLHE